MREEASLAGTSSFSGKTLDFRHGRDKRGHDDFA